MEVLKITTEDYTLNVTSNGVEQSFARANKRNKNIETSSEYLFTGNAVNEFKLPELINYNLTNSLTSASFNTKSYPVFFENKIIYLILNLMYLFLPSPLFIHL